MTKTESRTRIKQLEKALRDIVTCCDWLERDAQEADKVHCHAGDIRLLIARVHPKYRWPKGEVK